MRKMMCSLFSFICVFIICMQKLVVADTDTTEAACGKQKSTYGYEYNELFKFSDKSYLNGTLYLTFRVQTMSNAHIILSVEPTLDNYALIYEIVLGAGRNTFSDIRRYVFSFSTNMWKKGPSPSRAKARTEGLLSAGELREFTISLAKDGQIEIRKGNDAIPFLYWKDPEPIPVRYFGFSTWNSVYGIWFFDCYGVGSTTIDRPRTFTDSLRSDLLKEYDRFVMPFNSSDYGIPINISFSPYHVELDPSQGQFTLVGQFMLAWEDVKLKWNPASYGNITSLQLVHGEVWKPELVLYNSVSHGVNPLGASGMVVSFKGEVNWNPNSRLQSRCLLKQTSLFNNTHRCQIQLGLWGNQDIFRLVWVNDTKERIKLKPLHRRWLFNDLNATTKWIETPWYDDMGNDDLDINGKNNQSVLVLAFTLQDRNIGGTYVNIFNSIVLVITGLYLLSFWCECCDFCRSFIFGNLSLLMILIYKLTISDKYPVVGIITGSVCLVMIFGSVLSMYAEQLKARSGAIKPNSTMLLIVRFRPMQYLLCLPAHSVQASENPNTIDESEAGGGVAGGDVAGGGVAGDVAGGGEAGGDVNTEWFKQDWKAISIFVNRIAFYLSFFSIFWIYSKWG